MSRLGYPDYSVGDRVYCLAWIGQPFDVVAKDDERQAISVETPPAWPSSAQFDIFPETMFLLTQEHWDQIWHWPDQAGEVYFDVFQRFVDRHRVGQVVAGYQVPDGLMALGATKIDLDAKPAMMFSFSS